MYEWRSGIGKKGIAAVEWLWKECKLNTKQERIDYVNMHLKPRYLCMYRDDTVRLGLLLGQGLCC